jgi:hypothetical protein
MATAEREFAEFTRGVTELSKPGPAKMSAEDWLNEMASRDSLPEPRSREWQLCHGRHFHSYQSIGDTIVQLLASQDSGVIALCHPIQSECAR